MNNRYRECLLKFSDNYDENDIQWFKDINSKLLSRLFNQSKKIRIDSYDEFVYLWNFACVNNAKRVNLYSFLEFFDRQMYTRFKHNIEARIIYSDSCKYEICKSLNSLFKDKEINTFYSHAEIITSCYLNKDLDFLTKLKYLKKQNFSDKSDIYRVWYDSACIRSTDPKLYKKFFKATKKQKGYMDKKYDLCISAIENDALDDDFIQIIANSLITSKCFDLVQFIKDLSLKSNLYSDTKIDSPNIKNEYNFEQLYSLCVLLVQKRGNDLCDLATSFLPKEYCTWILPFATQRKSTLNLKRRFGIQ